MEYPRWPSHTVFDETTRASGPITTNEGWTRYSYLWSNDNLAEIEKGWIKKADTIKELAGQIGVDPGKLEETIATYNRYCADKCDPDFERPAETLQPIETPPFYAIATYPALLNTQGGPKHNMHAQVVDVYGQPIKRLYKAGEIGSMFGTFYPGAGNLSECMAFGRIAGRNAAQEKDWSAGSGVD
jgi:succinate dehydrogenase/fumarate reductase flavoprotein subunit